MIRDWSPNKIVFRKPYSMQLRNKLLIISSFNLISIGATMLLSDRIRLIVLMYLEKRLIQLVSFMCASSVNGLHRMHMELLRLYWLSVGLSNLNIIVRLLSLMVCNKVNSKARRTMAWSKLTDIGAVEGLEAWQSKLQERSMEQLLVW